MLGISEYSSVAVCIQPIRRVLQRVAPQFIKCDMGWGGALSDTMLLKSTSANPGTVPTPSSYLMEKMQFWNHQLMSTIKEKCNALHLNVQHDTTLPSVLQCKKSKNDAPSFVVLQQPCCWRPVTELLSVLAVSLFISLPLPISLFLQQCKKLKAQQQQPRHQGTVLQQPCSRRSVTEPPSVSAMLIFATADRPFFECWIHSCHCWKPLVYK